MYRVVSTTLKNIPSAKSSNQRAHLYRIIFYLYSDAFHIFYSFLPGEVWIDDPDNAGGTSSLVISEKRNIIGQGMDCKHVTYTLLIMPEVKIIECTPIFVWSRPAWQHAATYEYFVSNYPSSID